jgi:protein-S-isoprenylcysteine O-methyltransferase Ste14
MTDQKKKIPVLTLIISIFIVFIAPIIPILITRNWMWWQGWLYAAICIGSFIISRIIAYFIHPDLITERAHALEARNTKSWDKILSPAIGLGSVSIVIVAGFDRLYHWSEGFSPIINIIGLVILTIGCSFSSWALIVNRFFSGTVRIQKERGHFVVTTGPYRFIRHPGYTGAIPGFLCIPVVLDSTWAFFPAILLTILLVVRTALEDSTLQSELPGYKEYTTKTPYRLLPGIW